MELQQQPHQRAAAFWRRQSVRAVLCNAPRRLGFRSAKEIAAERLALQQATDGSD